MELNLLMNPWRITQPTLFNLGETCTKNGYYTPIDDEPDPPIEN